MSVSTWHTTGSLATNTSLFPSVPDHKLLNLKDISFLSVSKGF